jgi:hypothetical protein
MSELDEDKTMGEEETQQITIDNKVYSHVKTREYTPISIFKGNGEFLRVGPRELIGPELDLHKKLLSYGFPVPGIIAEGQQEDKFCYTEQSLGEELLGDLFWEDCKKEGKISNEHFVSLLNLAEKFAQAQLRTATESRDDESFYLGILMDYIQDELPELKVDIMAAFEKLKKRTSGLPTVLSHGDFNAYNLFEGGVIDFGNIHNAPAGYDIVSNIYHTYNFPKTGDYESLRRYEFTADQISQYFASMDRIYTEAGLPKLSDFREDFIWAKEVWATTRMEKYPKLRKWRYKKFRKILAKYLNDEAIIQTALEF